MNAATPINIHTVPLLLPTTAFIVGIVTSHLTDTPLPVAAITAIAAAIAFYFRRHQPAIFLAALTLGCLAESITDTRQQSLALTEKPRIYRASIISSHEGDATQSATIRILSAGADIDNMSATADIRARLTLPGFRHELQPGDQIVFNATFSTLQPTIDLPDEITPEKFLLQQNVYIGALAVDDQIISITPDPSIKSKLARVHLHLLRLIYQSRLSTQSKEFIATTLLGDDSQLTQDTRQRFSQAGLAHILALSGLHVGLIAMIIALALWPLKVLGLHKTAAVSTILLIWFYAAICGLPSSVVRAATMASIYIIGRMLQRRTSAVNSLCAAALVILIFDPQALFEAGFQLSFAAVLSIILFSDILNPVSPKHRILHTVTGYISVSLSAMLGTALIAAYYFHTMPVYFVIANIVAAVMLPFLLGGAVVLLCLLATGINPVWLCKCLDLACDALDMSADWVASLPGSTVTGIYLPGWILAIYGATIVALYLWTYKRRIIYGVVAILAAVATGVVAAGFGSTTVNEPMLYVARTTYHTDIIINNCSDRLTIITTNPQEPESARSRAEWRYADFMGRRGMDSIFIVTEPESAGEGYSYNNGLLKWGGKTIAIAGRRMCAWTGSTDYLLVCRGYTESMDDAVARWMPDTIVLSRDLDPRRASRYADELESAGLPFIDMRRRAWSVGYSSN